MPAADPGAPFRRGGRPHHDRRQCRCRHRRHLRRRDGMRVVSHHAFHVAGRGLRAALRSAAGGPGDGRAPLRHHPGGGRTGSDGHRDWRRLERRQVLHRHQRPRRFVDDGVLGTCLLRRDSRRALGHPACRTLHRACRRARSRATSSPRRSPHTATRAIH